MTTFDSRDALPEARVYLAGFDRVSSGQRFAVSSGRTRG
jgi:hypothetical protein